MIKIDMKLLNRQYEGILHSNIDDEAREGLLNLLSSIEFELLHSNEVEIVRDFE